LFFSYRRSSGNSKDSHSAKALQPTLSLVLFCVEVS
jgi:hypothetical protein